MAALPARWRRVRRPDIHLDLIQKEVLFKILAAETEVKVCTCETKCSLCFTVYRTIMNKSSNQSKSAVNPSFFSLRASVHRGTINNDDDSSVQTHRVSLLMAL